MTEEIKQHLAALEADKRKAADELWNRVVAAENAMIATPEYKAHNQAVDLWHKTQQEANGIKLLLEAKKTQ